MWKARARESFLNFYSPAQNTTGLPFRRKWYSTMDATIAGAALSDVGEIPNWQNPKISEISEGLQINQWVIESNDQFPKANYKSIQQAMEDLVEYVLSGRHTADFFSEENLAERERSILRIAVEEGVQPKWMEKY